MLRLYIVKVKKFVRSNTILSTPFRGQFHPNDMQIEARKSKVKKPETIVTAGEKRQKTYVVSKAWSKRDTSLLMLQAREIWRVSSSYIGIVKFQN